MMSKSIISPINSFIRNRKRKFFIFSYLILTLILIELLLRLISVFSPRAEYVLAGSSKMIQDNQLVYRPNPAFPQHDQNGWRNESVPSKADIVALGDSQTYGTMVSLHHAWPQQLQTLSQFKVYNISYGGYGPTHSLLLLPEAFKLYPRIIIEAFYSGNDLYDCYYFVYRHNRLTNLRSNNLDIIKSVINIEKNDPITKKINKVSNFGRKQKYKFFPRAKFLSQYSKTMGLIFASERFMSHNIPKVFVKKSNTNNREEYQYKFNSGQINTVFTQDYRAIALDLDDIRIREGMRICLECIDRINRKINEHGLEFFVLLIPTKELAYKDKMKMRKGVPVIYKKLVRDEEILWLRTKEFLTERNIKYIDILSIFRKLLEDNINPYSVTLDGHPNPTGHKVIAQKVLNVIQNGDGRHDRN